MKKMHRLLYLIILTVSLSIQTSYAQEDSNFSLYQYNMNLLNPAYAGSEINNGFTFAYRRQWLGLPGAPKSFSATYSKVTEKKLGIAFNFYANKFVVSNRVNISTDISYNINLAEKTKLYFGIKTGLAFYNVDFSNVETPFPDVNFSENINAVNVHLGFGLYLANSNYYITLSTPNFIREKKESQNAITEKTNFYLGGGYHFKLNENTILTPTIMMRFLGSYTNTYDIGAAVKLYNKYTFGSFYRVDNQVTLYGLLDLFDKVSVGLSYDISTTNYNNSNTNGSLDVLLRYYF